ncbi:hypothetical protein [Nodularia chucula]|uniref:hypothetical protein n=1 Tax=Nodularia chucula TaxID=3093667 RepID=UPI0039C6B1C2
MAFLAVLQPWQNSKNFVQHSIDSISKSAQQFGESLKATAKTTTVPIIDTVSNTLEKTKSSIEQTWQSAVITSIKDWLNQHPAFLRLFDFLQWAVNHPIISLIILILGIMLILNLSKVIIRLIFTLIWSILQISLKLILAVIKTTIIYLTKILGFASTPIADNPHEQLAILPTNPETQNKHQRLIEISSRLATIQQEQQQLLEEAANLMSKKQT